MNKKLTIFIIFLLILLVAFGVYFGVKRGSKSNEDLSNAAIQIVQNYYNLFSECMENPPVEAIGQVTVYCQSHNQYVGSQLEANLDAQSRNGYVPVICAQNPPQNISPTGTPQITDASITVMLSEQYASGPVLVAYKLQKENGEWKVENILCPTP